MTRLIRLLLLFSSKQTIHSEKTFDFLRDLVANVPDHQPEEDGDSNPPFPSCSAAQEVKKTRIQRLNQFAW